MVAVLEEEIWEHNATSNRVAEGIDLADPTPPDLRVRVRRARRLARYEA